MFWYAHCIAFISVFLGFLRSQSGLFTYEKDDEILRDAIMTGLLAAPATAVLVADASTADLGLVLMSASMMAFFVNAAMENKCASVLSFLVSISSACLIQCGII